jgi:hypothetical protein
MMDSRSRFPAWRIVEPPSPPPCGGRWVWTRTNASGVVTVQGCVCHHWWTGVVRAGREIVPPICGAKAPDFMGWCSGTVSMMRRCLCTNREVHDEHQCGSCGRRIPGYPRITSRAVVG